MPILHHPRPGSILVCDFEKGFLVPEMVKRRPVIVVSPPISVRARLCTIVPISTEPPRPKMAYHVELPELKLPSPFHGGPNWVKADMVYAVSFDRLDLIRLGKDMKGKRVYFQDTLSDDELRRVMAALICSLGLAKLTKHL